MKRTGLPCVALMLLTFVLPTDVTAAEIFDEFLEASFAASCPARWSKIHGGNVAITGDGELLLDEWSGLLSHAQFSGDVSIRARGTFRYVDPAKSAYLVICAHHDGSSADTSYMLGLSSRGGVTLELKPNGNPRYWIAQASMPAPFDPESDYILQLDVIGTALEVRVWPAANGDCPPAAPLIVRTDVYLGSGGVAVGFFDGDSNAYNGQGIFRYAWARSGDGAYLDTCALPPPPPPCESPEPLYDDFEDGSLIDGCPSAWEATHDRGAAIDAEGLVLENWTGLLSDEVFSGDVSIRTQGRFRNIHPLFPAALIICAHHDGSSQDRSYMAGLWGDGVVSLELHAPDRPYAWLATASMPLPFDPEADHVLQLDVVGTSIELRVWPAADGDCPPVAPLLVRDDTMFRSGVAALGFLDPEPVGTQGVFRYAWAQRGDGGYLGACDLPPPTPPCEPPQEIYDDFEYGNLTDGCPVTWTKMHNHTARIAGGELTLDKWSGILSPDVFSGDVSIRTQGTFRNVSPQKTAYLVVCAHHDGSAEDRSYMAGLSSSGRVTLELHPQSAPDAWLLWEDLPTPFDPEAEYALQLDVIGSTIELRVWSPDVDACPPTGPLISKVDATLRSGFVSLGFWDGTNQGGNGSCLFRHVWIQGGSGDLPNDACALPASPLPSCDPMFRRGDCNDDGKVDLSDAVCILNWLFLGADEPGCVAATNSNSDRGADLSDAIYLLGHLFLGGPPPAAPFPGCGPMPQDETSTCKTPPKSCP